MNSQQLEQANAPYNAAKQLARTRKRLIHIVATVILISAIIVVAFSSNPFVILLMFVSAILYVFSLEDTGWVAPHRNVWYYQTELASIDYDIDCDEEEGAPSYQMSDNGSMIVTQNMAKTVHPGDTVYIVAPYTDWIPTSYSEELGRYFGESGVATVTYRRRYNRATHEWDYELINVPPSRESGEM